MVRNTLCACRVLYFVVFAVPLTLLQLQEKITSYFITKLNLTFPRTQTELNPFFTNLTRTLTEPLAIIEPVQNRTQTMRVFFHLYRHADRQTDRQTLVVTVTVVLHMTSHTCESN